MAFCQQNLKRIVSGVSLSAMLFTGGLSYAETLDEALAYTFVANPSVLSQRAYVKSIYEKITQSSSGYRPTIAAQGQVGYAYDRNTVEADLGGIKGTSFTKREGNENGGGVTAVQPLFSGFSTQASVKASREVYDAERENLKNVEQSILLDAVVAYTDIIRESAVLKLNQNNEAVLERQLAYIKDRFRVGELTKTDIAQSEARLAKAQASRIEAEGAVKVAYASYQKVIGKVPEKVYEPQIPSAKLPETLEDALEVAQKRNPSLLTAVAMSKSAISSIKVAEAGHYPTLDVEASYMNNRLSPSHSDTTNVALVLKVPLYTAGNVSSRVREAKHKAGQARINVDTVRRDILKTTAQAWEAYQSSVAGLVSLEEQVRASEIALEGVKYEEQAGMRTVLDVLDAEQELLDARVSVVVAKKTQIVASYQLLSAMGLMNPAGLGLDLIRYQVKKGASDQAKQAQVKTDADAKSIENGGETTETQQTES